MSFRSLGIAALVSLGVSTMCAAQVTDQTTTQSLSTGAGQSTEMSSAPSGASDTAMTSSVAVIPFENRSPSVSPSGIPDVTGRTMADHLQRSLEKTGKFKAVERSSVDLAVSQAPRVNGRFDSTVENKLATDLGAKYVVYGTVTQSDVVQETDTLKLPGVRVDSKETEGTVAVTLTAVDATTGDVVATATGTSEEEGDKGIEIRDKDEAPSTSTDSEAAMDILDEASEEAVDNAAKDLAAKLP